MTVYHLISERHWGDIGRYVLDLCMELRAHDHEAHIVCRKAPEVTDIFRENGLPTDTMWLGGVLDVFTPIRLAKMWDRHAQGVCVHVHSLRDGATALRAKRLSRNPERVRIVMTLHQCGVTPTTKPEQETFKGMDAIILPSEHERRKFEKTDLLRPERLHAIHTCIRVAANAQEQNIISADTELFNIIFTGPITADKGLDILVKALAMIAEQPWHLHVVGTGDARVTMPIVHLSRGKGIDKRITWHGETADYDTIAAQCHIGAVPSRKDSPIGKQIIEYMSRGLATVATDNGSTTEIITPGVDGVTVPPEDPAVLAEALKRMMSDPKGMSRIAADGYRTWRERFTYDKFYDAVTALYRQ